MLADNLEAWTDQWLHQGWEEGLKEGREEGREAARRLLLRLVSQRLGQAVVIDTAPLLARIEDLAQLEKLGDQLLLCADEKAWLAAARQAAAASAKADLSL